MRKNYPVLRYGSVDFLLADGGLLAFGRWDDKQAVVVVINNGEKPVDVTVPVWRVGVFDGVLTELVATQGNAFREPHSHHHINAGHLQLTRPACSAVVFGR
jgi:alpha-glucosidase